MEAAPGRAAAPALEFRRFSPEWADSLARFFSDLLSNGDENFFHPHPLTPEFAQELSRYSGRDLYYVAVLGDHVLAYGMLRGWDEGFAVPSLGIALHPDARGTGLARVWMGFLHAAAHRRGAVRVRLKVDRSNRAAFSLYQKLGYTFANDDRGELVGHIEL
jgi:ribosomal-protein-alanine N-acetyltransferase